MAIYHFTSQVISRGAGRSAVAAIAYRRAEKMYDERQGVAHDYSNKPGVVHSEMGIPEDAPEWVDAFRDGGKEASEKLWNMVEEFERRKDSQLSREIEFSLPVELNQQQNIELARAYINEQFVGRGMIADWSVHMDNPENPHVHVMLTMRPLTEDGFGEKRVKLLDPVTGEPKLDKRGKFIYPMGDVWGSDDLLQEWREQWAVHQNQHLREYGFDIRVDHRSYQARGIEIEPTKKIGAGALAIERKGQVSDRYQKYEQRLEIIRADLSANPSKIIELVNDKLAVFKTSDVARELHRYFKDGAEIKRIMDAAMLSREVVSIGEESGRKLYTTKEMIAVEQRVIDVAGDMRSSVTHEVKDKHTEKAVARYNRKLAKLGGQLSPEQIEAIEHITQGRQMGLVMGVAGAGKSTLIEVAKEAWEKQGYRVRGAGLSGMIVKNLEDSGIRSTTLHALEGRIASAKAMMEQNEGKPLSKKQSEFINSALLSEKDVLLIDEAGMVGARQTLRVLEHAREAGAKVVFVGDHQQLQSIEAGAAFRTMIERNSHAILTGVRRQRRDWMQQATKDFASLKTRVGLDAYDDHSALSLVETDDVLVRKVLKSRGVGDDDIERIRNIDQYRTARQVAGRIYYEAMEKEILIEQHQDYSLFKHNQGVRGATANKIINDFKHSYKFLERERVDLEGLAADALFAGSLGRSEAEVRAPDYARKYLNPDNVPEENKRFSEALEVALPRGGATRITAQAELVSEFMDSYDKAPDKSRMVLAYSRRDVEGLNSVIRRQMLERGIVSEKEIDVSITRFDDLGSYQDKQVFAKGDRVMFRQNNKDLDVKNGSLGTIRKVKSSKMVVELDSGRKVSFSFDDYSAIEHGYAATVHKAQGVTVDEAYVLASPNFDRHATYVALSRHRDQVKLFASRDEFVDYEKLKEGLSRESGNLSTLDILKSTEHEKERELPGSTEQKPAQKKSFEEIKGAVERDIARGRFTLLEEKQIRDLMNERGAYEKMAQSEERTRLEKAYRVKADAFMSKLRAREKKQALERGKDKGRGIGDD